MKKRDSRISLTLFLVLGLFLICWTPLLILIILQYFNHELKVSITAFKICALLAVSNSGMNFIVYSFRDKKFKCWMSKGSI